jgi:chloride channel protein, CIC family
MKLKAIIAKIIIWKNQNLSHKTFVMLLSVLVGFTSGIAAVVIKNSVHLIQRLLTGSFTDEYHNFLYIIYPTIGIILAVSVIRYFIKQPVRHGIPNTLYAISKRNSNVRKHNMFSSIITSSLTVGFGGSVGLEGPTVATSAAIGSNIGRTFRMNYKTKTLLIGCAAAGALASIFNAPIAAIVFAIEVIMIDLTTASLVPLLMASATAALTSRFFLGSDVLFHFPLRETFAAQNIPFYILLGILTGLVSIYFSKTYFLISGLFDKIKTTYLKTIIAGVFLGALLFLLPPLYGEGYELINALISGNHENLLNNSLFYEYRSNPIAILLFLAALILGKAIASTLTFSAGGVGGIFAPSLFLGTTTGYFFASVINYLKPGTLPMSNFTLVGMAGVMAGILHAPLTAIFLIAEITGGYELFIPLMVTASLSYVTVKYFGPHSIYTMELAKRGELITHDKDHAVLTLMKLKTEIETDFLTIEPDKKLADLVKLIARSKRNIFPVVDNNDVFYGVILLDQVRDVMFDKEKYETLLVQEIMTMAPEFISSNDNMEYVMSVFEKTGAWNLPVLDEGKYLGFVSKSKLFTAYRKLLVTHYGVTE